MQTTTVVIGAGHAGLAMSHCLADRSVDQVVLWATGFRPDYSWLDVPVLDRKGYIKHDGGVVKAPGMYLLGMPFLRRRKSSLIDGGGDDARDLSDHLVAYLADGGSATGFARAPARGSETGSASEPQVGSPSRSPYSVVA